MTLEGDLGRLWCPGKVLGVMREESGSGKAVCAQELVQKAQGCYGGHHLVFVCLALIGQIPWTLGSRRARLHLAPVV